MSISKRKMFEEEYKDQEEILEVLQIIDKPLKINDLLEDYGIGKWSDFNFKLTATANNNTYKCLCPVCNNWLHEWANWLEAKENDSELKAKCDKCNAIIPEKEINIELIKPHHLIGET